MAWPPPNPGMGFQLVSAIFGGGDQSTPSAFHEKKYRQYSTERVKHLGNGVWEFRDPEINAEFRFMQDKYGNYRIEDPATGKWVFHDMASAQVEPIIWNIGHEQQKMFQGGGVDDDFNLTPFNVPGSDYDPNKKDLPWQHYAMKTGPNYKPVTKESIARDQHFAQWTAEQKQRNQQASEAMAEQVAQGHNPMAGGLSGMKLAAAARVAQQQPYQGGTFKPKEQYVDPATLNPHLAPRRGDNRTRLSGAVGGGGAQPQSTRLASAVAARFPDLARMGEQR